MVASDTTFKLVEMTGTAIDTSNRSVTPSVTNVVNWPTLALIEFTVVTTSCRPPSSCALSCVNTAGTLARSMPSTVSNANRCAAKPNDTRLAPIVSQRSARIGPKLCVVRWNTPRLESNWYVNPDAGDGSGAVTIWLTSAVPNWLKSN